MTLDALIAHYGVLGLFLGSGLEGEAVVVTGGILAHRGLVPLWAAMLASATGSCIVDQIWFFTGRYCRHFGWVQRQLARRPAQRALGFLERHPNAFIFGFRFVYGMRTISPIVIGTSRVPIARFVLINMIAAAIWGPLFTWIGYEFGRALDPVMRHIHHGALLAGLAVAIFLLVVAVLFAVYRKRQRAESLTAGQEGT
jgi:membrane protein DedA with SNARE-associated domain